MFVILRVRDAARLFLGASGRDVIGDVEETFQFFVHHPFETVESTEREVRRGGVTC